MRTRGLIFIFLLLAVSAFGQVPKPVDCNELIPWLASEVSSQSLARFVQAHGVAFAATNDDVNSLLAAGAGSNLVQVLRAMHPISHGDGAGCSALIAKAGSLLRQKNYEQAEPILGELSRKDPKNAALHFALGYARLQQGDVDGAFDALSDSKDMMPGFPETHSRLAYVFYRYEDGDSAIAEARTALSMDPQNAEAYRYLGLGLYANQQYQAALHDLDHVALDGLAALGRRLDPLPRLLEPRALLRQDQAPVGILLLEHERVDLVTDRDLLVGVHRPADAELGDRDDPLRLVADVDQDLVLVDADHGAGNHVPLAEVGQRAVVVGNEHPVHLDHPRVVS